MFITDPLCRFSRGFLRVWKRRRVFRMTAHFQARKRNCYSQAVKILHRALRSSSKGNHEKHKDNSELYSLRINAACEQLGFQGLYLRESLDHHRIFLSKRTLSDLSIWEPRSFKAITHLGWKLAADMGLQNIETHGKAPDGVITRGMLKK